MGLELVPDRLHRRRRALLLRVSQDDEIELNLLAEIEIGFQLQWLV